MTDNLFPFLADGLVDGGVAADAAPPDLRPAVDVLRAANQSGSVEELATMATLVQQFTAAVAASTNTSGSNDSLRSAAMSSTRITRRALSIVAITLLAAGTAAAAASGALPMFEDDATEVVVDNGDTNEVTSIKEDTHESDTTQPIDDEATDSSVADTVVKNGSLNGNGTVDHHGKCTAWTNGSAKDASNPAFAELQVSADAGGLTIDEYCKTVLATTDSNDEATTDDDQADDQADDKPAADGSSDDDESADESDSGQGNRNRGNGGSGNSGSGNGGHGNGNTDDSDD